MTARDDAALQGRPVISERALRIGIDGEALRRPMTGVGRYVFHLGRELEALLPQARFFVYARGPLDQLALPSARWQPRLESSDFWRKLPSTVWAKWRSPALIEADRLDLYWAGRTLLPPLPAGVRSVSVIHDLNCWVVPETMPFKHRWAHKMWFGRDVRRADHRVANSQGTAQRLQQRVGVAVDGVVCPGVDASFAALPAPGEQLPAGSLAAPVHPASGIDLDAAPLPAELVNKGLRKPYLLAVATLEPRKNLGALLQAFRTLKAEGQLPDHQLALVGSSGWGAPELLRELEQAGRYGVVRTGYMPDDLLPMLYQHATALVFPSIYEGFGMPVIEARACGTRVVVSDVPELREVAGPDGIVVAPTVAGIREGILRALAAPRPDAQGVAEAHSWAGSALRLARLFVTATAAGTDRPGASGGAT